MHTPGPWRIPITCPNSANQVTVATTIHRNAALITAAPDLLGALKSLLHEARLNKDFGLSIRENQAIAQAAQAVAKAEE